MQSYSMLAIFDIFLPVVLIVSLFLLLFSFDISAKSKPSSVVPVLFLLANLTNIVLVETRGQHFCHSLKR